jgi:hypothetical protein
MMKVARLVGCALIFFFSVIPTIGQPTQEEQVVRKTYAKLIFGAMIERVHQLLSVEANPSAADFESAIANHQITFELSEFSAGSVAEIAKRPYADLVTRPDGQDIVSVATVTFTHTEDLRQQLSVRQTEELGARVGWAKGQDASSEDWLVPSGEALPTINSQNHSNYSRYVRFNAAVSLDGHSRRYKAMFLFGSGQVPVLVLDNVTNNSALAQFVNASVYPEVLLESGMAEKGGVADWLRLHQFSAEACPSGKRQVCCDLTKLTCGVSSADLDSSVRKATSHGLAARVFYGKESSPPSYPHLVNVTARLAGQTTRR